MAPKSWKYMVILLFLRFNQKYLTMVMNNDLIVSDKLRRLDPDEIHRVFLSASNDRRRMEEAIKDNWEIKNEDFTLIILSFLQFLTNNGCKELNEIYKDCKKNRKNEFSTLLIVKLHFYLSDRETYKDQRHNIYNTLVDVSKSTSTVRVLKKAKELKAYFWGENGEMYESEIQQMVDKLNKQFRLEQPLDVQTVKEVLRKALCTYPEMILCSYDFSDTLDNWRECTAKRIISQIGDLKIIENLKNHEPEVTRIVFFSSNSEYRSGVDMGIREAWALDKEDYFAVVNSFVYDLTIRKRGSKLKQLKKRIVRDVPYIQLPLLSTLGRPTKWTRYEDGNLRTLLQENAYLYAEERSEFKDERLELKRLFDQTQEERESDFSQGGYDARIDKAIQLKEKKYGKLINGEVIMKRLKLFLCDSLEATFARYDFQETLAQWQDAFIKNIIDDLVKLHSLMNTGWQVNILEKEYRSFIQKKASLFNIGEIPYLNNYKTVNDLLAELFFILWENDKKVLKDFKFDKSLDAYINSIIFNHIYRDVKQLRKKIEDEDEQGKQERDEQKQDEQERIAENLDNDLTQKGEANLNEEQQDYVITIKDKAIVYHGLIEILKNPNHRKYLHLHKTSKTQERQFQIFEEIHVNLTEFTKKEQTRVRKKLIAELDKEKPDTKKQDTTREKASSGEFLLRKYEQRVNDLLKKIVKEIESIRSMPKEQTLTPEQTAFLDDYMRVMEYATVSQLKQESNE